MEKKGFSGAPRFLTITSTGRLSVCSSLVLMRALKQQIDDLLRLNQQVNIATMTRVVKP
jgi:hypothetical protein